MTSEMDAEAPNYVKKNIVHSFGILFGSDLFDIVINGQ